jgi:hypothetical protein
VTLTLAIAAPNPNRMRQSTPTLTPSEGSQLSCRAERRCRGTATLLVIEILRRTLTPPVPDECEVDHVVQEKYAFREGATVALRSGMAGVDCPVPSEIFFC